MRVKRILAAALTLTLVCGVLPAPTLAAEGKLAPFVDLQDPQVAEAAEFLRLMGVVDGTGDNAFTPDRILTRAEFCKMAVELMGNGDKVAAQMNRTVFRDVPSTHWARGYINVATQVSGTGENATPAIIRGDATGLFHPDDYITTAEAVTILMRVLNYSDSTVGFGATWYDGYMSTAASVGLTEGLSLTATDTVTRGQTAVLLYNLYFTELRDSKDTYLTSKGGKEVEAGILLDVDTTADDNSPAVKTTKDTYKTDRELSPSLEGRDGKAILDANGKLLAFIPTEGTTQRIVSISSVSVTSITIAGGERITVKPETDVYQGEKISKWESVWKDISTPAPVTLHYGANGKLGYLFFAEKSVDGVTSMVARTNPNGSNPFASMADGSYTMFKNGMAATATDIRQWDVATYDAGTRVIQVSDLKLTGVYENADPTPSSPTSVTLMGQSFSLLPSAWNDFDTFKIGDRITLLLTSDGKVVGAVSADVVKGDAVGVAKIDGTDAEVELVPSGLIVSGKVSSGSAERYDGQLVTVASNAKERLSLSLVSGSNAKSDLDVAQRKLGDQEIAENAKIYDKVLGGEAKKIEYSDITQSIVSKNKISFVSYDYAGRVRCMVLDDVTGNAYQYGYFFYEQGAEGDDFKDPDTLCVRQAPKEGGAQDSLSDKGTFLGSIRSGIPGGIALSAHTSGSGSNHRIVATVTLQSLSGVSRSAFNMEEFTVTVAGVSYPISNEVQCYNKTTKTWFKSGDDGKDGVEAARAYSDDLTLYYDRDPNQGGKIRMIIVP